MDATIVTIELGDRAYDIYIGGGLLDGIAAAVPLELAGRAAFIVTDAHVESYANRVGAALAQAGAAGTTKIVMPPGEQTKSFAALEQICGWLLDNGVSRNSVVFAVGGGVIGDLAGFAAASIMRGVGFVQVPTTLLAQVDSSVGGKTGINMPQGKNLVGAFYQPAGVVADTDTLKTLPRRELLAGYAEVAKYGLIDDSAFFAWLEENGEKVLALEPEAVSHAIEKSVRAKARIVEADEKEGCVRALLNLGHTFGHALEAAAGYDGRLLHGEAVAIGIVMAFDLSSRLGLCARNDFERVEAHFTKIGLPVRAAFIDPPLSAGPDELLSIMRKDKKAVGGTMKFILARGIGESFITDEVPEDEVRKVLADSLGGTGTQTGPQEGKGRWKSAFSSLL